MTTRGAWLRARVPPTLDRYVLGTAVRAAIVVPAVLALVLELLDDPGMASLAFFGAVALLLFVDFGGPPRTRLLAYVALTAAGAVLVVLGTLCSANAALATAAMAVVGFAVLFAGIFDSYVAAASRAGILAFVLPAMVPVTATDSLSQRLLGWLLGCGAALLALALPWPRRPPDKLRVRAVAAIHALGDAVTASAEEDPQARARHREATTAAIRDLRRAYLRSPARPTGTGGRGAALGQLVEDVVWLHAMPLPPPREAADAHFAQADEEVRASAGGVLRASARLLEEGDGAPPNLAGLLRARRAVGDRFMLRVDAWRTGTDEPLGAELEETYRLRSLSYATWQLGGDALRVAGRASPDEPPHAGRRLRALHDVAAAHATMRSVWLRNSVRGAIGLALAVLVGQLADVQHSFWVVLGTLAVLRSQALTTGVTLVQELAGTVAGIAVGGLLVYLLGTDTTLLWVLLPPVALVAAYARRAISFPAGQAGFSVQLLIVFNLIQPSGWSVGLVRVEDVAIGASISLLTALLLWPRGASGVLRDDFADAYDRSCALLVATVRGLLDGSATSTSGALAQAAAASWQRLDATLRQYLSERARRVSFDDLSVLVAGVTRLRRAAEQLSGGHQLLRLAPTAHPSDALRAERAAMTGELDRLRDWYAALADAIRQARRPPRPPVAPGAATLDLSHDGGAADDLLARLAVAWTREQLVQVRRLQPRLAAAAGNLAPEGH